LASLSGSLAAPLSPPAAPAAPSVQIRTPGSAATHVADEAAAYAREETPAPVAAPSPAPAPAAKGLAGRLLDVVRGRSDAASFFDASSQRGAVAAAERPAPIFGRMGLTEHKPVFLPNGSAPDEQPTIPSEDREPSVRVQTFSLPGARDLGTIAEENRRVLASDPNDLNAVVAEVRRLIDSDRTRFGVSSSELRLVNPAKKFEGRGDQADSIFINFRQIKNNVLVNGAHLSFTIKVINDKAVIVAQLGQVFPNLTVDTDTTLTPDQIMQRIADRIGMPVSDAQDAFKFVEEKIIYSRGAWHHVNLYTADGLPFMVAVDLASGLVFAWDNRTGAQNVKDAAPIASPTAATSGVISGKAVDHGPIVPTASIKSLPLGFLNLTIGGKTFTTDKDGRFSAPGLDIGPEGVTLTATLSGPFANVLDTTGKTLKITVTVTPGDGAVTAVFNQNSTLNDENALAQVSAFHKVNLAYSFLKDRNLTTERMDKNPITIRTNINDECNAYYTPGSPSLNFFKSSANCVNSAYDTVADHEYGHYWDDMTGGIMNGGLSEGWGDIVSMYLLNNPIIGEHFLKVARNGVDYIRHGENKYQYNEFDEVHAQGQAWGGFGWKLRKGLMQLLGDAEGAGVAESLVLATMFAKAATIPDAMAQVLVNALKKDGTLMHEKLIRDTAKAHGITLPNSGPSLVGRVVEAFTSPLRKVALAVGAATPSTWSLAATAADEPAPNYRATLKFTAGALLRNRIANEIRKYMDQTDVRYKLLEYKGWFSTDFVLVIEGPQEQVQKHSDAIAHWMAYISRD
jgi:hypothetical protein